MDSAIVISLLAFAGVILSPILVAWLTGKQRHQEKLQDWERQDQVATKVSEAAEKLAESNKIMTASAESTGRKLDVIHTLVNSNMTAALQGELNATLRELAMMQEVLALKSKSGLTPTPEALAAIQSAEKAIAELTTTLAERLSQAKLVEAQTAISQAQDAKAVTTAAIEQEVAARIAKGQAAPE